MATIAGIDSGSVEAGEYLAKADDDAKERFVYHAAGLDGRGGRGGGATSTP